MKKVIAKIKDNIITGAIIIIPLAALGVILFDTIKKIIKLTAPFTDNMELGGPVVKAIIATVIVLIALGVFFFINGLIIHTYLGKRFKDWMEAKIFSHIPFYETLSGVTKQVAGVGKQKYQVVEFDLYGNKSKVLGLLTDTLADGRHMIFTPFAPLINVGQVHIVNPEDIKVLEMTLKEATDIMTKIGFEADKVYK